MMSEQLQHMYYGNVINVTQILNEKPFILVKNKLFNVNVVNVIKTAKRHLIGDISMPQLHMYGTALCKK